MEVDITSLKKEFVSLLRSTKRDGIEEVLEELDDLGFFTAPASTRFHLNYDGGLCEHSLNVCRVALKLRKDMIEFKPEIAELLPEDSVIISALLHDVCKADIYKKVTKHRKSKSGITESYPGFDVDFSNFPLGHGEKSVIMLLRCGLEMSDYEIMAIRWHMAAWDLPFQSLEIKSNINTARDICPLCGLIQSADTLAANILERSDKQDEDDYIYIS